MKFLRPITNPEKLEKIDASLSWVVRYQSQPRGPVEITLFKLAKWVAVPSISESLLTPMGLEQLQRTCLERGANELWGVLLNSSRVFAYTVPVTLDGLEEFRREMGALCCALFAGEPKPDWVLLSIERELDVIAGPSDFVRQSLGCEIEEAFSRFQNKVMEEPMPKQVREYLLLVHDRLKGHYQSAEVGAEFSLNP